MTALDRETRERIMRDQRDLNAAQIRKHAEEVSGSASQTTAAPPAPRDWRHALDKRGDRYVGDERNVALALRLAPELRHLVRFNRFAQAVEFARAPPWRGARPGDPWADDDDVSLQIWLQQVNVDVRNRATIASTVTLDAKERPHHPVLGYLNRQRWDQTPRLDTWLADYLGASGPADSLRAAGAHG
jgi:predicted P-loop ATPase